MAVNAAATGTWTIQSTNNALAGRLHDNIPLVGGASLDPSTARSGVLASVSDSVANYQDLLVAKTAATGALTCTIASGGGVINRSGQGPYEFYNQGAKTVTLTAANGANPRIDRISARVYDLAQGDTIPGTLPTNGGVQFEVTDGVAAGSPVAPALPANSIPLAQVLVPAAAVNSSSLSVTDLRSSTGEYGSTRPLLPGDISAWTGNNSTSPTGFGVGELLDTGGLLWRWNGVGWKPALSWSVGTYTPVWSGMANSAGTTAGRFWLSGNICDLNITHTANASTSLGTSNVSVTLPFVSANITSATWNGEIFVVSGAGVSYIQRVSIGSNSTNAAWWSTFGTNIQRGQLDTPGNAGTVYGNGGSLSITIRYEIA